MSSSVLTSCNNKHHKAQDFGVPVKSRHVFLDNQLDSEYINQQFTQLIHAAKKHQVAIAIAHPHPETIKNLKRLIPTLKQHNIELVALSSLYAQSATNKPITIVGE